MAKSQWPLLRRHPGGSERLRPRIRSKQVRHNLQGHRTDARLRRSAYQVPAPQVLHEHASVIPVAKCHSNNMATDCDDRAHIGPAHVDNKIVHEVLRAATGDTLMHASARAEVVQTQSPIPAPRGRICDNADSSVRAGSFLFCNQQVRRISRKSPSRRRMTARRTNDCRSRHVV